MNFAMLQLQQSLWNSFQVWQVSGAEEGRDEGGGSGQGVVLLLRFGAGEEGEGPDWTGGRADAQVRHRGSAGGIIRIFIFIFFTIFYWKWLFFLGGDGQVLRSWRRDCKGRFGVTWTAQGRLWHFQGASAIYMYTLIVIVIQKRSIFHISITWANILGWH